MRLSEPEQGLGLRQSLRKMSRLSAEYIGASEAIGQSELPSSKAGYKLAADFFTARCRFVTIAGGIHTSSCSSSSAGSGYRECDAHRAGRRQGRLMERVDKKGASSLPQRPIRPSWLARVGMSIATSGRDAGVAGSRRGRCASHGGNCTARRPFRHRGVGCALSREGVVAMRHRGPWRTITTDGGQQPALGTTCARQARSHSSAWTFRRRSLSVSSGISDFRVRGNAVG